MRALHEPDAREGNAYFSTETRGVLPDLNVIEDDDAHQRTVVHDQVGRAVILDASPWEETTPAEAHVEDEDDSASAIARNTGDPETDHVLARYFGEVSRFALLSFAEEQTLGRRIIRWQRRVHWALYTAPLALPTLRRLWQQVEQQAIPPQDRADLRRDDV